MKKVKRAYDVINSVAGIGFFGTASIVLRLVYIVLDILYFIFCAVYMVCHMAMVILTIAAIPGTIMEEASGEVYHKGQAMRLIKGYLATGNKDELLRLFGKALVMAALTFVICFVICFIIIRIVWGLEGIKNSIGESSSYNSVKVDRCKEIIKTGKPQTVQSYEEFLVEKHEQDVKAEEELRQTFRKSINYIER